MRNRFIEITTEGSLLSVDRGFLKIRYQEEEIGRVPLDDLAAVIVHAHSATFTSHLAEQLAARGCPLVLSDRSHNPVGVVWPIDGHHEQGLIMEAQASASRPTRKRLWRDIVKAKITAQAAILEALGKPNVRLSRMLARVRSGDTENIEAQAARHYWPLLMGDSFRRNRSSDGINGFLNFGYSILRSATARSIVAAGLHPSLSLHHISRGSALRLADDLMEPFRPYVDFTVARLMLSGQTELDKAAKGELVSTMSMDMIGPRGTAPLQSCLDRLASSLARVFLGECKDLELPQPPLELSLASVITK
ncbi:type II CRISPR-associated endonuclease Cas1 [Hyphobacterium indicum]|uniref:type II CRISPR-associated endonuclease Cas1 n=1 Tax=Hyphobacterium indicum TaxID=2162714 RepID=UPI000D651E1C|nr:type II CRISPR-associated endonuclease Cas1 [Hyphobacterium indicum]